MPRRKTRQSSASSTPAIQNHSMNEFLQEELSQNDTIETIDINPFLVLPEGAVALDALIIPRKAD